MPWTKWVDMSLSDEAKLDMLMPIGIASRDTPEYPPGLRICLCENELEKLNLSDPMEVGEIIDIRGMGRVTSVSSDDGPNGKRQRVEIQIEDLAVEIEGKEEPGEEEGID